MNARLEVLNLAGTPYGHLGWDTDATTTRLDLAVFEDGAAITRPDGTLQPLAYGGHMLAFIGRNGARLQGRLVRIVVDLDDGTTLTSPPAWFGTLPAVEVDVAPTSMQVDVIGAGDGFAAPDGRPDGVFDVRYEGPVKNVALVGVNRLGSFNMWVYDTVVGDDPIPAGLGRYAVGAQTWTVGVEEGDELRNAETGALDPLPWTRGFRLYATQTAFLRGRDWKVVIELPDGSVAESEVFRY